MEDKEKKKIPTNDERQEHEKSIMTKIKNFFFGEKRRLNGHPKTRKTQNKRKRIINQVKKDLFNLIISMDSLLELVFGNGYREYNTYGELLEKLRNGNEETDEAITKSIELNYDEYTNAENKVYESLRSYADHLTEGADLQVWTIPNGDYAKSSLRRFTEIKRRLHTADFNVLSIKLGYPPIDEFLAVLREQVYLVRCCVARSNIVHIVHFKSLKDSSACKTTASTKLRMDKADEHLPMNIRAINNNSGDG